jgi:aspartate racemase
MNTNHTRKNLLGVVGGMGPLASAEFLKTIYEYNISDCEQESPPVVMYSDPTFPDRTESFLAGSSGELLARLTGSLERLCDLGASRLVICCFTIHHLVPRLPLHLREKIWSLVDVALASVRERRGKHLLVCATGARSVRLFEDHDLWEAVKGFIVLPDEADQGLIHGLIYKIKRNHEPGELTGSLRSLLSKYSVNSFLAGCTEIHLLTKHLTAANGRGDGIDFIDPLTVIAERLGEQDRSAERTNSGL